MLPAELFKDAPVQVLVHLIQVLVHPEKISDDRQSFELPYLFD